MPNPSMPLPTPGCELSDSQDEMLLGQKASEATTATESDKDHCNSSLHPVPLFHQSRSASPVEGPSCITHQRQAYSRERAMTSPSCSAGQATTTMSWVTMSSSRRSRSQSILGLFPIPNGQNRTVINRRRSQTANSSLFSGFSGTHVPAKSLDRLRSMPDVPPNVQQNSSIRIICPTEGEGIAISEIYRPLEKDVDPRISRPFMPFASGRTYGPADIRVINVPPPNTPNPAYRSPIQSQHASPIDERDDLNRQYTPPSSKPQAQTASPDVLLVGFWHKSMAPTRASALVRYGRTLLVLLIAIFLIITMATGISSGVDERISSLSVAVVDLDSASSTDTVAPIVGPYIRSAFESQFNHNQHLNYRFPNPVDFHNDAAKVYEAVYKHDYWAAVVIHADATTSLMDAALLNDISYNPRLAATIVCNEARDFQTYESYITPILDHLALSIASSFEPYWLDSINNGLVPNGSSSSTTLSPGISFSFLNIRPAAPSSTFPVTTVNIIYLILISFYSCTFFMHTHILFIVRQPTLRFSSLVIYRWCATMTTYLFFALMYSLVTLTIGVPFSRSSHQTDPTGVRFTTESTSFGPIGNFFTYLALNFVGTAALGLASENMAMFLSFTSSLPYSLLFLLFWIASNVSTSFYSLELAGPFYTWGYGWPMYNLVEGTKTLVLGVRSNLTVNFAVLAAWVAAGTIAFPLACWLMRWKGIRAASEKRSESISENSMQVVVDERVTPRAEAIA